MELQYVYSESTVKPAAIEVGVSSVYLRKDITEEVRTVMNDEKVTYYTFQEAVMTIEEFNTYANTLASINAVKDVNNASNILLLLAGQDSGDTNQMTIMEAIADLYDAVASLSAWEENQNGQFVLYAHHQQKKDFYRCAS